MSWFILCLVIAASQGTSYIRLDLVLFSFNWFTPVQSGSNRVDPAGSGSMSWSSDPPGAGGSGGLRRSGGSDLDGTLLGPGPGRGDQRQPGEPGDGAVEGQEDPEV